MPIAFAPVTLTGADNCNAQCILGTPGEVARLSSKAASAAFEMVVASFEVLCQLMLEIRMKYAKWEPAAFVLIGQRTPSSTVARRLSESGLILLDEAEA